MYHFLFISAFMNSWIGAQPEEAAVAAAKATTEAECAADVFGSCKGECVVLASGTNRRQVMVVLGK